MKTGEQMLEPDLPPSSAQLSSPSSQCRNLQAQSFQYTQSRALHHLLLEWNPSPYHHSRSHDTLALALPEPPVLCGIFSTARHSVFQEHSSLHGPFLWACRWLAPHLLQPLFSASFSNMALPNCHISRSPSPRCFLSFPSFISVCRIMTWR